jgi:hypothetical protein
MTEDISIINLILTVISVSLVIMNIYKSVKNVTKSESWLHALRGFHASLDRGVNEQEAEIIRKNIASTLHDIEQELRKSWYYRYKEIKVIEHQKRINKLNTQ